MRKRVMSLVLAAVMLLGLARRRLPTPDAAGAKAS